MFSLTLALLQPAPAATPHTLSKKIASISLYAVEGDVRVDVDPEARRTVIETLDHRPGHTCAFQLQENGREAHVSFGPKDLEDPRDCRMDFSIRLSPGTVLDIDLGIGRVDARDVETPLGISVRSGDIRLTDVGGVTLEVGEGDISLDNVLGEATVSVESGRVHGTPRGRLTAIVGEGLIDLRDLDAPVHASTAIGNIWLDYRTAPSGELALHAGKGNIVVGLPAGTPVGTNLTSTRGDTRCELPHGEDLQVNAIAGMGSILVRGATDRGPRM